MSIVILILTHRYVTFSSNINLFIINLILRKINNTYKTPSMFICIPFTNGFHSNCQFSGQFTFNSGVG